jgi:hypothetical protein
LDVRQLSRTLAGETEPAHALTWLQQAITVDSYNEPLHQQAVDLLHAAADYTGVAQLMKGTPRPAGRHQTRQPPLSARSVVLLSLAPSTGTMCPCRRLPRPGPRRTCWKRCWSG